MLAPAIAAVVFLIIASRLNSESGTVITIVQYTLLIFTILCLFIMAKGSYDAQTGCSMEINQTITINDTATYTYEEQCTSTVPQSASMFYTFVMWLFRIIAPAFGLFLIYWVFTGLADKEKLT